MAFDGLGDLDALFRRLEEDPESIDPENLIALLRAVRKWILVSSARLQNLEERMAELEAARQRLEERMAQLEAALEALQKRYEESEALLQQALLHHLWWALARGELSLLSAN